MFFFVRSDYLGARDITDTVGDGRSPSEVEEHRFLIATVEVMVASEGLCKGLLKHNEPNLLAFWVRGTKQEARTAPLRSADRDMRVHEVISPNTPHTEPDRVDPSWVDLGVVKEADN